LIAIAAVGEGVTTCGPGDRVTAFPPAAGGRPQDLAGVAVLLASPASDYVNGTVARGRRRMETVGSLVFEIAVTSSTTACWRCSDSTSSSGSVRLVANGNYSQLGKRSPGTFSVRTRRTTRC
jgi:hypothetical protein